MFGFSEPFSHKTRFPLDFSFLSGHNSQLWNFGGTEVHNPNVDPRGGTVCLGVWKRAPQGVFKLTHRVWNYDTNGNFMGTIHLSETLTLGNGGNTHSGSFTLGFFDPSGNFLFDVTGSVAGERVSVE